MSPLNLEERVAALEQQMTALQAALANGTVVPDWRATVGLFTGDDVMKRIDEAARKMREADRRRARRQAALKTTGRKKKQAIVNK